MKHQTCDKCRFWEPNFLDTTRIINEFAYRCVRYAPGSGWSSTYQNDGCGEWESIDLKREPLPDKSYGNPTTDLLEKWEADKRAKE